MKKCVEYEVEGPRPRRRPKRTWREVVEKDCQARKLNKEDAIDRSKWRKLIKDVRWSVWVWVGECFFWYRPTLVVPDKRLLNRCVCVCNSWLSRLSNLSRRSLVNVNANDLLHPFSHCWHHTATDLVPGQSQHTHTSSESTTISSCRQTWTFSKAVSLPQTKIGKPVAQSRQKRQVCGEFAVVIIAVQKSQNPSFRCKPKTKKPFSL